MEAGRSAQDKASSHVEASTAPQCPEHDQELRTMIFCSS